MPGGGGQPYDPGPAGAEGRHRVLPGRAGATVVRQVVPVLLVPGQGNDQERDHFHAGGRVRREVPRSVPPAVKEAVADKVKESRSFLFFLYCNRISPSLQACSCRCGYERVPGPAPLLPLQPG